MLWCIAVFKLVEGYKPVTSVPAMFGFCLRTKVSMLVGVGAWHMAEHLSVCHEIMEAMQRVIRVSGM